MRIHSFLIMGMAVALQLLPGEAWARISCSTSAEPKYTSNVESSHPFIVHLDNGVVMEGNALYTAGEKAFGESDLFVEPSDLLIGFDAQGAIPGHVYVTISSKYRFDGHLLGRGHTLRESDWKIPRGVFFRYKNVSPSTLDRIQRFIESEQKIRGVNCVASACKLIFDIAELGPSPGYDYWFPGSLLNHLATEGLINADGAPLEVEFFTMNTDSVNAAIRSFSRVSNGYALPYQLLKTLRR